MRAAASAAEPRERLTLPEFSERHRIVTGGERPGRWSNATMPHLAGPMAALSDDAVTDVACQFPPQCGKTEVGVNLVCEHVAYGHGDVLIVLDSADNARDYCTQRLLPALRAAPLTADRLSTNPDDIRKQAVGFRSGTVWLVGANSPGKLSMKAAHKLVCDEIDKWPQELRSKGRREGAALTLAVTRTDSVWRPKRLYISTPTDEGVGINEQFNRGDKARRYYPCPRCGGWQRLVFRNVTWEGGSGADIDQDQLAGLVERVRASATYRCEHCGKPIDSSERLAMLLRGKWVSDQQEIGRDGVVLGDPPSGRFRSFTCSWLDLPHKSFGDLAAAFVEQRGRMTRDFVNQKLGEPWAEAGSGNTQKEFVRIVDRVRDVQRSAGMAYDRGQVPAIGRALLGAIDVQKDHVWWAVWAWGPGYTRFLVDWGRAPFPRVPEHVDAYSTEGVQLVVRNARPLVDVLDMRFRRLEHAGGVVGLAQAGGSDGDGHDRVLSWAIDCRHRTAEIYRLAAMWGKHGRIVPVMGVSAQAQPIDYVPAVESLDPSKRRRARQLRNAKLQVVKIKVDHWKDELDGRITATAPTVIDTDTGEITGAELDADAAEDGRLERVDPDATTRFGELGFGEYWPNEIDATLAHQLTSEHKVPHRVGGSVREFRWKKRHETADNHLWDCAVYNLALHSVVFRGGPTWDRGDFFVPPPIRPSG